MKPIRALSLILLIVFYGMPLPVLAQEMPETFSLPTAIAGEPYRANILSVLRDNYRLKLETDARSSSFHWALAAFGLPPGLVLRTNGTILGIPRVPRDEPYQFQLKVRDVSLAKGDVLRLDFRLTVSTPRIRLAHVNSPRLVPREGSDVAPNSEDKGSQQGADSSRVTADTRDHSLATVAVFSKSPSSSDGQPSTRCVYASMLRSNHDAAAPLAIPQGACDPGTALGSKPSGDKVFTLDARNGTASGKRQFERGDTVSVVIDNKNPFLYKYTFTKDAKVVEETALGSFFSLIGGVVSDFAKGTSAKAESDAVKSATAESGVRAGVDPSKCVDYTQRLQVLDKEVGEEIDESLKIADQVLPGLEDANKRRSDKYDVLLKTLHSPQETSGKLYCTSTELLAVPEQGASPNDIKLARKRIGQLRDQAQAFKTRAEELSTSFPDCADMNKLNRIRYIAEGLVSDASKYDDDLQKIEADLKKMNDLKNTVASAVSDPSNFREVHEFGPYAQTTEVSLGLTRKALSAPDDKESKAEDLVKGEETKLKFGQAPFFSLSGGLVFSPLRKREFNRVQGFERDQQGNLVLVNGKANLTTVVGLKETSPTRIAPAVFLNGRLVDWNNHLVDGLHMSLGITAKNDSKGIDPEFLLGPSLSMLERKMFFTFGAYAGRQQKLTGGLFEGFAVPSTVTDLPIQKNYRWSFGFALSYQLPINKK